MPLEYYENNLLSPTLCGKKWLGNSQQGKNNGINSQPNLYYKKILNENEINQIKNRIRDIESVIQEQVSFEIDFKNLDDKYHIFVQYGMVFIHSI